MAGKRGNSNVKSWFGAACRHSHIQSEIGVGPIEFSAGPSDAGCFFSLNLLPHTGAIGAFKPEIVKIGSSGELEGGVAFFLEFDAANGTRRQALRHELELVAVFNVFGQTSGIELGFDAEEIGIGLSEMFGREVCGKQTTDIFEDQLEKTGCDRATED